VTVRVHLDTFGLRCLRLLPVVVLAAAFGTVFAPIVPLAAQNGHLAVVAAGETVFSAPGLGRAVSVYGDVVIAGGTEAVEAYALGTNGWQHTATLRASDGAAGDRFGAAVDLRGSVALIGAPDATVNGHPGAGAAYVFQVTAGGTWVERARLVSASPTSGAHFGASLRNSGELNYVIGSPGAGLATIFEPTTNSFEWTVTAQLTAPDLTPETAAAAQFGASSALEFFNGIAAVGAPGADGAGAVYTYRHVGSAWVFDRKLADGPRVPGGRFGQSMALEATSFVIGSPGARAVIGVSVDLDTGSYTVLGRDLGGPGFGDAVGTGEAKGIVGDPTVRAAYLYGRSELGTRLLGTLLPSEGPVGDGFGASVDVWTAAVVGAPGANAIHIFDLTTTEVLDHMSIALGKGLPYAADGDVYGSFTVARGPAGNVTAVVGRGRVTNGGATPAPFIIFDLHQLAHSNALLGSITIRDPGTRFAHTLLVLTNVRILSATKVEGSGVGFDPSPPRSRVVKVSWAVDDLAP
jgi:hypothetical protein